MKQFISFISFLISLLWLTNPLWCYVSFPNDSTKKDVYYFVSNRNNIDGKYTMYKARTNQSGISSCLIKGNFEVDGFPHMRKAEISVYNISTDKLVGIYNTNPKTGNYLIILVPNVKYEFIINTYGYAPIKKIVEIPHYASTNVLGEISSQKMLLKMNQREVSLSLNTWVIEDKEPTLFLLTVYNESKEDEHNVELYQATNEDFDALVERDRRKLKETDFGDIDELIQAQAEAENQKPERAEKAFNNKNYELASTLYGQLLRLDENNTLYNYRKGLSVYHLKQNKLKALSYLKKASEDKSIPYDVFYYMGKSYHLWSDFQKAQAAYETFKAKASEKEIVQHDLNRLIENCSHGKKLMEEQLNMEIVNKRPIDMEKLPKGYPKELIEEKVLEKTKFFISPLDEKKKTQLLMCKTEQNEMIQTSYGLKDVGTTDLFVNKMIGKNQWGASKPIEGNINTPYNESYAYVTLDGRTMYFSSEGHNSIGGYDIFVCTRSSANEAWSEPKNIGYPINSPYDDILFVPDFAGEYAYFSSNRRSPTQGYNLYKIKMPKPPLPLTVIKGHFMTNDSIPNFSASIAVYNTNNQEIVGIYNTNMNNGNFLMALMPGIKYEFAIQCDNFKEHLAYVTVPVQTKMFALRQNIRLKKESAFEILNIDNFFTKEEAENAPEYKLTTADFPKETPKEKASDEPSVFDQFKKPTPEQLQLIENAEQFFINKQYIKAVEQFAKVAPVINLSEKQSFYYGKALYNISRDYEKTLKYLEKAALDKNTPYEVFYMLGKTNHNAYRFERAVKAYERYMHYATEKEIEVREIKNEIELSQFGKKLVNEPKPIEVLSKKEFDAKNLHNIYNSIDINCKFLLAPEDMVMPRDKKSGFKPTMFLNNDKTLIYFSSYGMNGETGKDIYLMRKLPNNTWTEAIKLSETINTTGDEDYPYLTPDGKTLYFCSTKHGSMGGYDIFKSMWNEKKDKWNKPVNLGAPINSPFDDFYFVE